MGDITFGNTIEMLKDAISGASAAHTAIANNVANVNTPNFKRSDVSFKDSLAATQPQPPPADELELVVDDPLQIPSGPPEDPQPFKITTNVDDSTFIRQDGSNVDIDQEMAKLSLNSQYAQTMGQLLTTQYTRIREAIQGHA